MWITSTREEPVVAARSRLIAIRPDFQEVAVCDCVHFDDASCTGVAEHKNRLRRPFAVDLATGSKRALLPAIESPARSPISFVDTNFELGSAAGSLVHIADMQIYQPCTAAHPMFLDDARTVDVANRTGQPVEPSAAQIMAMLDQAEAQLKVEQQGCVLTDEKPKHWGSSLVWGPGGRIRAQHVFTMPAPYSCGTGPGHYSVATTMLSDELPAKRPAVPVIPAWVTAALGNDTPRGLSPLPAGARRAVLLDRFRRAPIPAVDEPQ